MHNPTATSSLPVLAGRVRDLSVATADELRAEVEHLRRGATEGWLDRVYQVIVTLSAAQGHIYSIKSRPGLGDPWSVGGVGFDALNRATGVTVTTVDEQITWDGIMPAKISLRRMAVGYSPSGALRIAPVRVEILARHYRFERIRKASSYRSGDKQVAVAGFSFGVRAALADAGLLGLPHQIWLKTETLGDGPDAVEVGYALDSSQQTVRGVLEDGASFAKNLSRAATTIAGRLASKQWHGLEKIKPSWLYLDGTDICARVPLVGWRSDLQRSQIEGLATEVAAGADIEQAIASVGVRSSCDVTPQLMAANPDATDDEYDENTGEVVGQADPTLAPAAAAMHGADLGLDATEQRVAVEQVTGEPTRASVTTENVSAVKASLDQAAVTKSGSTSIVGEFKRILRGYKTRVDAGEFGSDDFRTVLSRVGAKYGLTSAGHIQRCTDEIELSGLVDALARYCGEVE